LRGKGGKDSETIAPSTGRGERRSTIIEGNTKGQLGVKRGKAFREHRPPKERRRWLAYANNDRTNPPSHSNVAWREIKKNSIVSEKKKEKKDTQGKR